MYENSFWGWQSAVSTRRCSEVSGKGTRADTEPDISLFHFHFFLGLKKKSYFYLKYTEVFCISKELSFFSCCITSHFKKYFESKQGLWFHFPSYYRLTKNWQLPNRSCKNCVYSLKEFFNPSLPWLVILYTDLVVFDDKRNGAGLVPLCDCCCDRAADQYLGLSPLAEAISFIWGLFFSHSLVTEFWWEPLSKMQSICSANSPAVDKIPFPCCSLQQQV